MICAPGSQCLEWMKFSVREFAALPLAWWAAFVLSGSATALVNDIEVKRVPLARLPILDGVITFDINVPVQAGDIVAGRIEVGDCIAVSAPTGLTIDATVQVCGSVEIELERES